MPSADQGGGYPPLAGAQGVDSYTKLLLHADGSDQGTSFTDSSSGAKTVTNTESYDSYTKLMLHMENGVTDSAAGKTVTNNNVTFSNSAYKMGSYSGAFNGSNAFLSAPNSNDFDFGMGDFTIDFWIYINGSQDNDVGLINFGNTQGDPSDTNWVIYFQSTTDIRFLTGANSQEWDVSVAFTGITTGTWLHLAVVRTGNVYKSFTNGVLGNTVTNSNTIQDVNSPLEIGRWVRTARTRYFNGMIDELRISKGIARWTSDFTPPSSPYGRVATVTSQKKFGTASGEFHGSGNYLSLADSDDWDFGTGDFTIDCWIRWNSFPRNSLIAANIYGASDKWWLGWESNVIYFYCNYESGKTFAWTPSANTWYHFALTRSGTNLRVFIDGTQIGSTQTLSGSVSTTGVGTLYVGGENAWVTYYLNGNLDELRISKGIARWTSNFTPPSAPYDVDTTPPTVSSTSPASNATGVGISSAISATFSEDMDSSTINTNTFTLSGGGSVSGTVSYSNKTATFTPSGNLSYSTTYTATITTGVKDISGNAMSSTYTWSFTTSSAPDTTAPSGAVAVSGASYTNSTAITLNLSATDNVGVTGYYISDSSSTPSASASGWTSVTSTTSYSATVSYTLSGGDGSKTIYVWYKDAAGNVSSTANATITLDTTVPTVTISSPTSSSTYTTTSSTISLGGSASDSSSGISSVTWSNDRGGSGTATGTASWTVSGISLSSGDNKITVTAKDGAGNSGTDSLQVTYSTGNTVSAPTVSTGSATNVTTSSVTLNGTVNANGASTTAWFNYGVTSGSYTGTSTTQSVTGSSNTTVSIGISGLSSNTKYYYRIAASNSGGTSYGGESSFTTSTVSTTPTPTPTPTTTQFSVTKHIMTDITEDEFNDEYADCETPHERTIFCDADAQATHWFHYENATAGDSSKWEWYAPDGTLYGRGIGTYTVTSGCWMSRLAISGEPAASKLGQWQVKVSRNGQLLFTDTFTIQKDTTAPSGSVTINSGASETNSTAVTLTLSATDNMEVTGYYVSQNPTPPSSSASGWTSVTYSTYYIGGVSYYTGNVSYTLSSGDGSKTVYAWFKDTSGNVSSTASDDITLDTTTPAPTLPPFPTPSPAQEGIVFGFVNDEDDQALEGVTVTIAGTNGGTPSRQTVTDADGYYEISGLAAGEYALTYGKEGYGTQTQDISLEEGETKDLGVVILEQVERGKIYGYAVNIKGDPLEFVRLRLKGLKTKVARSASSDADEFFEFDDLDADTYVIIAKKKGYRKNQQKVTLGEGESEEIEIVMRKTSKRIKEELLEEEVQ